jgi:uncharacterized SAM-binding protein YcdF (DUF218 family)
VSGAVSRRLLIVVAAVVALTLVWVAFAGRWLVATDPVGEPDVVFALSGDVLGDRVRRAIDVAAATDAERLVFFVDESPRPEDPPQIRRRAVEAGVPAESIRFLSGVESTAMEAGLAAGLVDRCGWRDVVVVTSPYHTRRAGWTFRRAVGDAAQVRLTTFQNSFDQGGWWRTEAGREQVLGEWAKSIGSSWYLVDPPEPIESDVPC